MQSRLHEFLPQGEAFRAQRELIARVVENLSGAAVVACGLVGSYARRSCSPQSDIDLIAVVQAEDWDELFTRHDLIGTPAELLHVTQLPRSFITGEPFVAFRFRSGTELTVHWAVCGELEPAFALRDTLPLFEKQSLLSQLATQSQRLALDTDAYLASLNQRFWHGLLISVDYLERGEHLCAADSLFHTRAQLIPMLRLALEDERALDWVDSTKGLRKLVPPAQYELIVQSVALPSTSKLDAAIRALLQLHDFVASRLELELTRNEIETSICARLRTLEPPE